MKPKNTLTETADLTADLTEFPTELPTKRLTSDLTERLSFEVSPEGVVRPVLPAEVLLHIERRNLRRARLRWGLGVGAILFGFFAADLVAARFLSLPEGVGLGLYVCAGLCAGAAAMVAKSIR